MCHITDTSSIPSRPVGKSPSFSSQQPSSIFLGSVMCKNVQKYFYQACKINGRVSRRRFQRFYYEKTLVAVFCHRPPPPPPPPPPFAVCRRRPPPRPHIAYCHCWPSPPFAINTSNPFKGCLEVTHKEKAIPKLASGKQGLLQGYIIFLTLSNLEKRSQKCLCNWEVVLVLAGRKQGLLQGCAILLKL